MVRQRWLLVGAINISCAWSPPPQSPLKASVADEFGCAYEDISMTPRSDLGPRTIDVDACGHLLRYKCDRGYRGTVTCIRQPTEDGDASEQASPGAEDSANE
jgi:hypothetical protein